MKFSRYLNERENSLFGLHSSSEDHIVAKIMSDLHNNPRASQMGMVFRSPEGFERIKELCGGDDMKARRVVDAVIKELN